MQWWQTDQYDQDYALPPELAHFMGPRGAACVRVYKDGKTQSGWGMNPDKKGRTFMENYLKGKFSERLAALNVEFALVMRSLNLVCVDIDGKNGGIQNAGKLGMLPPTLAETSKSGDGYHLFYATPWDSWDKDNGFAMFKDRIGIVEGVDLRAVGCVFHYPTQRWNGRAVAELPTFQKDKWLARAAKQDQEIAEIIELLDGGDPDMLLVAQSDLIRDLAKPIPAGRRNNTLYAIGTKMLMTNVPDWENLLMNRGRQIGLDSDEMVKLVTNVRRYR